MYLSFTSQSSVKKKIEGSLKGLFVVFLARFPYNPILYYAHSSLLKENNNANNSIDYLWDFPLCFIKGDVFTSEFVPCFYFKLRSVSAAKKKRNICQPKLRLIFFTPHKTTDQNLNIVGNVYLNKLNNPLCCLFTFPKMCCSVQF